MNKRGISAQRIYYTCNKKYNDSFARCKGPLSSKIIWLSGAYIWFRKSKSKPVSFFANFRRNPIWLGSPWEGRRYFKEIITIKQQKQILYSLHPSKILIKLLNHIYKKMHYISIQLGDNRKSPKAKFRR